MFCGCFTQIVNFIKHLSGWRLVYVRLHSVYTAFIQHCSVDNLSVSSFVGDFCTD